MLFSLLSSELFNSKERVTMYFPMRIGPFSNKIAIVHFSTEGVKKKPMRDLALGFYDPFNGKIALMCYFTIKGVKKKPMRKF